ncbi:MAG TPA: DNA methyltransferase, partial [Tepidisphaeraceae bacterium]
MGASAQQAERFVEKWRDVELSERAASHEHFIDLCRLIGQPTPAESDPTGQDYCFEKPVKVTRAASKGSKGGGGFVDVWKRGCFAWEYKRKDKYKNLDEAYRQLYQYRDDLDNPPLSVVCDIRTIEIRTHFPGYPTEKITVTLEEIPGKLEVIRRVFASPETFRPAKTSEVLTTELADEFAELANRLIDRYPPGDLSLWMSPGSPVAHFLMKVMFCLFAEDINLLPDKAFTKLVNRSLFEPESFITRAGTLFTLMRTGGEFGNDLIPYFNGGLFDDASPLPLKHGDLLVLRKVADRDWSAVEPSIFGTLFERLLDPRKRAQIGAHYTSKQDILLVVEPVVMVPLRRRWQELQGNLADTLAKCDAERDRKKRDVLIAPIKVALEEYRRYLGEQRVLDPACGSGNFLYVCLRQMLDLEDEVVRFATRHDISVNPTPHVRPAQLHGIEINPYAAELAQVVIWIGYLQWLHDHGIDPPGRPILDKLQNIEQRDAILDLSDKDHPAPAKWPEADFIIGNPPFLGSKLFRKHGLSDSYLRDLWRAHDLPRPSDLCCYWFELARNAIDARHDVRAGLLATQAIRGGSSREVLSRIKDSGDIYFAWSDRNWILDGAAVHVSIIGFDGGGETIRTLNGLLVESISPNLCGDLDTTLAKGLEENYGIAFMGDTKGGPFNIEWQEARQLISQPNPSGESNADILRPWINGSDIASRPRGMWIIDFGCDAELVEAASFTAPFALVEVRVKPDRTRNRRESYAERWWIHVEPRPAMRAATQHSSRYLVTPRVTKHRLFSWSVLPTLVDSATFAFSRADDFFFGVIHGSVHELWARRMGTQLREVESGFRYTPSSCFETFPLPWPPGKEDVKHPAYVRVSEAAKELNELRERWLNPPEWIGQVEA